MNNKLPFDDAFHKKMEALESLNEDAAWQKMKLLLEEKKKRRPLIFFKNYRMWVGAGILLFSFLWIANTFEKSSKKNIGESLQHSNHYSAKSTLKKSSTEIINREFDTNATILKENNPANAGLSNANKTAITSKQTEEKTNDRKNDEENAIASNSKTKILTNKISVKHTGAIASADDYLNKQEKSSSEKTLAKNDEALSKKNISRNPNEETDHSVLINSGTNSSDKIHSSTNASLNDSTEHPAYISRNIESVNDSSSKKQDPTFATILHDSTIKADVIKSNFKNTLKDSSSLAKQTKYSSAKKKIYFVDAGIQIKQQIPLSGQEITAYNYNGNKNIFSDYVPGIYIRFEKNKQWFLQAEFNYATPSLVKPFLFSRQTQINYDNSTVSTTYDNLQKTFFSELPLSFNYYIRPKFFIGAGIEYSWFRGAVTNQEITLNNIQSGEQTTQQQIIPVKNYSDSFLYNSNTGMLIQAGYAGAKWTFNLRYTIDMNPFITYTQADGEIINKKNSSLEFIAAYRLFRFSKHPIKK